ncbi:MAG: prepilin-type N-terminal cleavage/methylation domain-containing protein, partial [Elusimicrobiaceae bacterium]|nr:prepilin-type N-terminal cleavage/methylation domain-containing protein [Elusimicrobiaceae bacterium]
MKNKKKAFTLTELLVVVIVIGVLSAAVLPKFSKVIETRKTTEAEELMASIRTEQEKRCALDKPYIVDDISRLNDIVTNPDTKNYKITLQGTGVIASSKGNYSYNLQMPSYADGRICCDGDDCAKLNKNYPSCQGFTYEPSPDSCAGTITPVEPEPIPCLGSDTQP